MVASHLHVASHRHSAMAERAFDAMSERSLTALAHGAWRTQSVCSLHTSVKPTEAGYAKNIGDGIRLPRGVG